jgi:OmpA-OmpF porin, OOP family
MSFNIAKRTLLSSIIAASSISTLALAQQQEGFTLTPSIGYYNMDSDRDIKDDKAYSLGLGYQFNNPWAVEFVYLNADSKSSNGNKVDVDQYRLDGLYHLPSINTLNLTPYLAAGVGTTDFSNSSSHDNIQINAGGGLKYAVNDTVSLRADFRLVNDVEEHHLDNITSLGVQMTFGSPAPRSTNNNVYASAKDSEPAYTQVEPETQQTKVTPSEPITEQQDANMTQAEPITEPPVMAQEEPTPLEQQSVPDAHPPLSLNIEFGSNKTVVEQKFYPEIEKLATYLKENPNSTVVIEGHTDDTGAASYNQTVSEKRAKAIADVLIRTFEIDETRVRAIGYGEQEPLVNNDSAENRQANRRVVAVISSNEA